MKKFLLLTSLLAITLIITGCSVNKKDDNKNNADGSTNVTSTPEDNSWKLELTPQPGFTPSKTNPTVVMETTQGNIEILLYTEKMPITAGNFEMLVRNKFYDGIIFHRVIDGFMIQGGDPLGQGTGGPNYSIKDEFVSAPELSNLKGTLSMANSGPNTGGSQFFINLVDNTYLDFDKEPLSSRHPVFGKVVSGFDVVEKIGKVETDSYDKPITDVVIKKAYIK